MSAAPDSTLLWCLERLCTADELPYEVLVNLAGFFSSNNQLPGVVRCRMILKGLANTLGVDYSILGSLTLLSGPIPDVSTDLLPYLIPPAELILQVKTELVAQVWHNSVMATPEQIVRQVTHVFGPQLAPHEEARYNELLQAATNPTYRQRYSNFGGQSIAEGVRRFARGALDAMGPTLLEIINNDVNMGRYNPGVPPSPPPDVPRPQPIRPAPMRAVAPEPSNGLAGGYISPLQPYTSPQQYTAPQSVRPAAPGLNEAVAALRNAGGVDPIQGVMQQAALATAMAAKQNNPSSTPFAPAMESPDAGLGTRPTMQNFNVAVPPLLGGGMDVLMVQGGAGRPNPKSTKETKSRPYENRRGIRRKWTQEEVDALLAGCRIHKPGHWAQILHHAGSVLTGRTQVDLKDKWRNLRKANHPEVLAREAEVAAADAMTAMRHEVSNGGDTELQEEQEEEQEDKGEEARNGAEEAPEQAGNGADEAAEAAMPETEPESRRTRTRKQKRK